MAKTPVRMLVPRNKLLKSLPADDLDRLKPHLIPVTLEFKQHLVEFDQPIKYVYFLEDAITSTRVKETRSKLA